MSLTRSETDLLGSVASPVTVAHGGTPQTSTALDLTTGGIIDAVLMAVVTTGSSVPTVATTVAWQYSLDGTNYVADVTQSVVLSVASTSTPFGPYLPPIAAKKARCVVTNADATNDVTAYVQGNTLSSSVA